MSPLWFQLDHDFAQKPEFLRIRRASGLDALTIRGALSAWFEQVSKKGEFLLDGTDRGILRGYGLIDLTDLIGLTVEFWQLVVTEGWIEESAEGLIVPKFAERFGRLAKRRGQSNTEPETPKRKRGRPRKERPHGHGTVDRDRDDGTKLPAGNGGAESDAIPDRTTNEVPAGKSGGGVSDPVARGGDVAELDVPPDANSGHVARSQFDQLTTADLSVTGKMLSWIAWCATQKNPLVLDDPYWRVRVVAAGLRATSKGVHTPLALFKTIVGKKRWTMLEPEDIHRAQRNIARSEQLAEQMQAARTGGPTRELIATGFGAVPEQTRESVDSIRARLKLKFG